MDVEIFVHGVPNGESFWGKDEDRNYFGNFYDQSCSDKVRFLVQTRSSNGKTYCYYNYLVYGNVVGNDGRDGSYFGLSIRFDAYCKDFISVYKVLDVVFCTAVVNNILKVQNGNYKYVIPDFTNAPDVLRNINSRIWELIKSALTSDSFISLDSFNTSGSQLPSANLYEITSSDVEATVRQYSKIAISPYYQTSSERKLAQQYEDKLDSVKQQYEARIKANAATSENKIIQMENELSLLRTNNNSLTTKIQKQKETIADQKETIEKQNDKIREINMKKQSLTIIEDIKEPVMKLASALGDQPQSSPIRGHKRKSQSFIRSIIPWINTILGVVIISMLISPSKGNKMTQHGAIYGLNDTINELRAENEELKLKLQSLGESDGNVFNTENVVSSESSNAHIDVSNYNAKKGQYLKSGKDYTANILDANNSDWQQWSIKGGEIIGEDNGASIKFTPTDNDVMLVYINSNGAKIERTLKAITE